MSRQCNGGDHKLQGMGVWILLLLGVSWRHQTKGGKFHANNSIGILSLVKAGELRHIEQRGILSLLRAGVLQLLQWRGRFHQGSILVGPGDAAWIITLSCAHLILK